MDAEARQVISRLKVTLPKLDVVVAKMSGGQRQAIAVARSTVFARKVVILDEPTAALGLRESRQVLNLVATLRDHGNAVILITHNMEHVVELADRAMVLRQGRKVGEIVPNSEQQAGSGLDDRRGLSLNDCGRFASANWPDVFRRKAGQQRRRRK